MLLEVSPHNSFTHEVDLLIVLAPLLPFGGVCAWMDVERWWWCVMVMMKQVSFESDSDGDGGVVVEVVGVGDGKNRG